MFLLACSPTLTGNSISSFVSDSGSIDVHFCPTEDCETIVNNFMNTAEESLHCALHDLNLDSMRTILEQKAKTIDVKLIMDDHYIHKSPNIPTVKDKSWKLMHNKFCIIDGEKVWTGSMNPTTRGTSMNNNNLLLIESTAIASIYEEEFIELYNQDKNTLTTMHRVMLDDTDISIYFCPEDNCADKIIKELRKAQHTIRFMTFSFTHAGIANTLLLQMENGVIVEGIYEKSQNSKYSTFPVLAYQGASVKTDSNKYNMHNKVFIIDDHTVITGSMNPTKNGDERNDENVLIIHNKEIAGEFIEEFEKLFS
jgi:phosphatidylserine/phosphatidylglycerophosphate/cardiolipin synthase-like enzyme